MDRVLLYTALHLLIIAVSGEYEERDMRRALQELEQLEQSDKRAFECKEKDEPCRGVPACCGKLNCYWPHGYSMFTAGFCVECVSEDNACQRDSQCCPHLMCDKGNAMWIDGTCTRYRRTGSCYRDGQCVNACQKKWYHISGTCS